MARGRGNAADGYAMAALLVAISVMAIVMSAALPVWSTLARREKEAELIFRGEQYGRAISLFQRKYGGSFPPNVDVLVQERMLRKKYKDPITNGDFELVTPGTEIPGLPPSSGLPGTGSAAGARPGGGTSLSAARPGGSPPSSPSSSSTGAGRGTSSLSSTTSRAGQTTTGAGRGGGPVGATAGVMGVRSKSTDKSLRLYNGYDNYNEWIFQGTQTSNRAGGPGGSATPGGGRGGAPGGRGTPPGRGTSTPAPGGTSRSGGRGF